MGAGRAFWRVKSTTEYRIEDAAGVEMLTQACQALDRAEGLADRIAEDGDIIRTPTGIKAHPGIREELAARGFVVRDLAEVGFKLRAVTRGPGTSAGKVIPCPRTEPLLTAGEPPRSTAKLWRCSLSWEIAVLKRRSG